MQSGISLVELAKTVEHQHLTKRDFVATDNTLSLSVRGVVEDPRGGFGMHLEGVGEFGVNDVAHSQIATRLGIPMTYYKTMRELAPELLTQNANYWFAQSSSKRMVRTLNGNTRALLSDRYRTLDNVDIMEAVLPVFSDERLEIKSAEVTEKRMYITALSPKLKGDVKIGDTVQGGITISNSEVGMGTLSFALFFYRLWCLNGMVAMTPFKQVHLGKAQSKGLDLSMAQEWFSDGTKALEDAAFFKKMQDTVGHILSENYFGEMMDGLRESTERKITGDPVKAIEEVGKKVSLTQDESSSVLRHLIEGGDLSAWGVSNAVTRLAHDASNYDRNVELQRAGARVIELGSSDWKRIAEAH